MTIMGRKPNPLVQEHFARGDKCQDKSNRYQYTCKYCHYFFPKARTEELIDHISRYCLGLTSQQQEHFQNTIAYPEEGLDLQADHASAIRLPYPQLSESHGHQALVEATYRVHHDGKMGPNNTAIEATVGDYENFFLNQFASNECGYFSEATTTAYDIGKSAVSTYSAYNLTDQMTPYDTTASLYKAVGDETDNLQGSAEHSQLPLSRNQGAIVSRPFMPGAYNLAEQMTSYDTTASLYQTVSDETDNLQGSAEHSQLPIFRHQGSIVSRPFMPVEVFTPPNSRLQIGALNNGGIGPLRTARGRSPRGGSIPRSPAIKGNLTANQLWVRHNGACIPCRVKRNSCSPNTPCRPNCGLADHGHWLWAKIPCSRKLCSQFYELYSGDAFDVIAVKNVEAIDMNYIMQRDSKSVSFYNINDPQNAIELTVQLAIPKITADLRTKEIGPKYVLTEHKGENAINKGLMNFMLKLPGLYDHEPYLAMCDALKIAHSLKDEEDEELVTMALKLWHLTHFLTSPREHWGYTIKAQLQEMSSDGIPTAFASPSQTMFTVVHSQVLSLASKLALDWFRKVNQKLENLLERAIRHYQFTHFLAINLLFFCVERMTAWSHGFPLPNVMEIDPPMDSAYWPLSQPPSYYHANAISYIDLMTRLIVARHLVPPTITGREGVLVHSQMKDERQIAFDETNGINGPQAEKWFREHEMTTSELINRQNAQYVPGNFQSLAMKFAAGLMLLENQRKPKAGNRKKPS